MQSSVQHAKDAVQRSYILFYSFFWKIYHATEDEICMK